MQKALGSIPSTGLKKKNPRGAGTGAGGQGNKGYKNKEQVFKLKAFNSYCSYFFDLARDAKTTLEIMGSWPCNPVSLVELHHKIRAQVDRGIWFLAMSCLFEDYESFLFYSNYSKNNSYL
jgi:hypothetical protein